MRAQHSGGKVLYSDLPGLRAYESPLSTIPSDLVRPDMVYKCNNTLVLIELTAPFDSPENVHNANGRINNTSSLGTLSEMVQLVIRYT